MQLGISYTSQDEHASAGGCLAQPRKAVQPTIGAQVEIQEDDVRLFTARRSNGVCRASRFRDDGPAVAGLYQQTEASPDDGMIVDQLDTKGDAKRVVQGALLVLYSGISILTALPPSAG